MEGFQNIESESNANDFEMQAEVLIASIPGFDDLAHNEKEIALRGLVDNLADRSKPNFDFKRNIGIAHEIGKKFLFSEEMERHNARMTKIGVTA